MSGKIAIVTDSTAYMTGEEIERYNLSVVPLTVNFEDGSIVDGIVDSRTFFARVDKATRIPFTSQPAVGRFVEVYQKLIDQDMEIISIHISSKLSGTVESALGAARMLQKEKISVIDSELTAAALALLVRAAARWAGEGHSRQSIVECLEKAKKEIRIYFVPGTLEYLKKGGRIGGAQALLGTLLQIKPVLHLKEGRVEVFEKIRTRKKAIQRILAEIPKDAKKLEMAVLHALAHPEAEELKKVVLEQVPAANVRIAELGPVISIHAGPGVVGLAIWPQE